MKTPKVNGTYAGYDAGSVPFYADSQKNTNETIPSAIKIIQERHPSAEIPKENLPGGILAKVAAFFSRKDA